MTFHVSRSLALLLLCLSATVAVADLPLVVPVDGEPFEGKLVAGNLEGPVAFETDGGRKELATDDLVRWGACVEPDRGPLFLLRDGTLLVAGILEATETELILDSDPLGMVRTAREQVAAVVFSLPASQLERDQMLDDAVRNEEDSSRVVLLNGDRIRGKLVQFDDRALSLRTAVGLVELQLDRIAVLTLPPAPASASNSSALVGLKDGSRLEVKTLAIDEESAALTLTGGLSCKAKTDQLVFLRPASPRIVYLSDLTPAGYRHVPYLQQTWEYGRDRNVLGGLLRSAGRLHLKGLGMHTAARISYVPPKGAKTFQAEIAIDDITDGMGSVRFRVFVDGAQKYVSPTIRGLAEPVPISVDVRDARRIDLVVDFADRADVQDHADWLDARFVMGKQ